MNDYLIRCITDRSDVIGLACVTTALVSEGARIHATSPTASAALGRALTGGLLMATLMKPGQRVALKFEGNGPLKKILVEADNEGAVWGFVGVPEADVPAKDGKLDVSGVLGQEGSLTVIKDLGLKEPYSGVVKLRSGEVAEDIAFYFAESEQIPSAVGLGVFVEPDGTISAAGGFLIQTLPNTEEGLVEQLIKNIQGMPFVTEILRQGKTPEDMLSQIFSPLSYRVMERKALSFRCACSRKRVERALIALGKEELQKLIDEKGEPEVTCEFCRTHYHFTGKELDGLRQSGVSSHESMGGTR